MKTLSFPTIKLGEHIKQVKLKVKDTELIQANLIVYGVTNTEGVSVTNNKASDDLGNYIVLNEHQFAYNPYRINVGSIGLAPKETFGIVSPAYVVFETDEHIDDEFLLYYLKSSIGINLINWYGNRGGVRAALRYSDLEEIDFPDISLEEQLFILSKIKKIESRLKLIVGEIANGDIGKLRQSILQQAVEGKLCEQNPEDEPASVLLERIKKEKDKLIKEGKIKKPKELPPISNEEKPFALPKGWEWCRLAELYVVNPKNEPNENIEVSFVPMNLISDGFNNKHLSEKRMWFDVKKGYTHFQEHDIGIAKITPCFENRKSVIFKNLYNHIGAGTTELFILRAIRNINNCYILFCLKNDRFINGGVSTYTGTAGQQRVSKSFIENFLVPIPPLQEQQRIVEKVNKLMLLCDELEKEVNIAQQYASQLMESVLQEAFSTDKSIEGEQLKQKCEVIPFRQKQKEVLWFAMAARGKIKQSTLESLQKRAIEIANGEK